MSYNLYANDEFLGPVATTTGWYDFTNWLRSLKLDARKEPDGLLISLWLNGSTAGASTIRERLQELLDEHGGQIKDTLRMTIENLISLLEGHPEDSAIILTDNCTGRDGNSSQLSGIGEGVLDVDAIISRTRRRSRV